MTSNRHPLASPRLASCPPARLRIRTGPRPFLPPRFVPSRPHQGSVPPLSPTKNGAIQSVETRLSFLFSRSAQTPAQPRQAAAPQHRNPGRRRVARMARPCDPTQPGAGQATRRACWGDSPWVRRPWSPAPLWLQGLTASQSHPIARTKVQRQGERSTGAGQLKSSHSSRHSVRSQSIRGEAKRGGTSSLSCFGADAKPVADTTVPEAAK